MIDHTMDVLAWLSEQPEKTDADSLREMAKAFAKT